MNSGFWLLPSYWLPLLLHCSQRPSAYQLFAVVTTKTPGCSEQAMRSFPAVTLHLLHSPTFLCSRKE